MALVCAALSAFYLILLARIILSYATTVWSPPPALTPVVRIIYDLTEPVMGIFRRVIPPLGRIDLSPIFVFIALGIIQRSIGC
jgi:YggT family protein